jgi:hypothetical protein
MSVTIAWVRYGHVGVGLGYTGVTFFLATTGEFVNALHC